MKRALRHTLNSVGNSMMTEAVVRNDITFLLLSISSKLCNATTVAPSFALFLGAILMLSVILQ